MRTDACHLALFVCSIGGARQLSQLVGDGSQSLKQISGRPSDMLESIRWGICFGLLPEWEDQPKMVGEDAGIWKGRFFMPNILSHQ